MSKALKTRDEQVSASVLFTQQILCKPRRQYFKKAIAAMANPPAPPESGRHKSLRPGPKSGPSLFLSHENRRKAMFIPSSRKKFWSFVDKDGPVTSPELGRCWIWMGCKATHGYGQFSVNGVHILAHKYASIVTYGPVPEGLHLHHKCTTKPCVNPDHTQRATPLEHAAAHKRMRGSL